MNRARIWFPALPLLVVWSTFQVSLAQQTAPRNPTPSRGPQRDGVSVEADGPRRPAADKPQRRKLPGMTPEREAAVMTFVKNHHSELSDLLIQLSHSSPQDYERAVLELFRTSERLAQIQERQPERYQLELRLWKSQSRAQLLAARLSMNDEAELRGRLQEELERQLTLKKELLLLERERLGQRLEKLDSEIDRLEASRQKYIEQQINLLTRASAEPPTRSEKKVRDTDAPPSRAAPSRAAPSRAAVTPQAPARKNNESK